MKKFWKWKNQAQTETAPAERTLYLNGTIAEESWFDDDVTPQLFKEELMAGDGNITVWINGVDCGTWTSPGDLGARRGRLNPPSVQNGSTQYGIWVTWAVDGEGCRVNGELVGDTKIEDLHLMEESFVRVRLGNRPDARYVGGFNLFGRHFGDYDQDLVLTVEY